MSSLIVEGGRPLGGRVRVEGNKNAALPLLVACLLTDEECELSNVPAIRDVSVLIDLLRGLGAQVTDFGGGRVTVRASNLTTDTPDPVMVGRLRGSVLLLAAVMARTGRVCLAEPGGDFPTRRTIGTHLQALIALGAERRETPGGYVLEAPGGLHGASFYLDEASVTGTETALIAAAAARGSTEVRHAACEPHVVELCEFLVAMGVRIEGIGTPRLRIEGGRRLSGARRTLRGDYIEAGTWAVLGAVTGGSIEVEGAHTEDLEPIVSVMRRLEVNCSLNDERLTVHPSEPRAVRKITTGLWPGFPSDMVSLITVLAMHARGQTLIHDWMYELRLFALEQLSAMKADLFLCDPHRMVVTGPSKLRGRTLDTRDLRSGMALIAAALSADGVSEVGPLETVERGYARLVERLQALGANVRKTG
ncbi:MAG: UDP-N-acetylglucosamine 1-carboxyvinyltransferase [Vicinamibacterales bacterium]